MASRMRRGAARARGAELRLGAVPRGPQGSGEAAREALARERAAISTSTVTEFGYALMKSDAKAD